MVYAVTPSLFRTMVSAVKPCIILHLGDTIKLLNSGWTFIIPDDIVSRLYIVTNFGTAKVSSTDSETIFFYFNEALLAKGVTIIGITGSCEDGTQEMFWNNYQPSFNINFTTSCANGSYVFYALNGKGVAIGFPVTIQVDSPTSMGELSPSYISCSVI